MPPIIPAIMGLKNLKLIPKIAGSVIPSAAESEEGIATTFVRLLRALRPTARHAPNCAKFAALAIGIHVLSPPSTDNIPASITLYM